MLPLLAACSSRAFPSFAMALPTPFIARSACFCATPAACFVACLAC